MDQTEINKAAVKRFLDAANTHDPKLISKAIDDIFDPDWRAGTQMPIEAHGPDGIKSVFAVLHEAFPDLHISIEDLIAEGDKVVARERITGTHRGNYMGRLPATGKRVEYNEMTISRLANGRIVESWGVVDVMSLMRQLGAIPTGPLDVFRVVVRSLERGHCQDRQANRLPARPPKRQAGHEQSQHAGQRLRRGDQRQMAP